MRSVSLSIDGKKYLLHQDADTDRLYADVVAAVRSGGGIVEFPVVTLTIHALITPTSSVIFETKTIPPDAAEDLSPDSDTLHAFNYDELDW